MRDKDKFESALKVQDGIPQPPQTNEEAVARLKSKKKALPPTDELVKAICDGDVIALSRAITLIESTNTEHQEKAQEVIAACLPYSGKCIRVGITGVPGVGKSTFIEAFGSFLTSIEKKVAVLAIDPSSQRSKGSILGDKTRMEKLSVNPKAFIRPSPSAGTLGGVSRKTRETMVLCEAAGFDVIIVETVGVGQSETVARSMVDFFLLLQLAGAGDELQGIKRGIMEMADAIFINKADGDNLIKAKAATAEYKNALHLFPPHESGWEPTTGVCSAVTGFNIDEVWAVITQYETLTRDNLYFEENRKRQEIERMESAINEQLISQFYHTPGMNDELKKYKAMISESKISPYHAAKALLKWQSEK